MLQEEALPRQRKRQPVPIRPTLVIGLGYFGREVGKQLAARLMLTEESLRSEGLASPLLACKLDDGKERPGFVRIMGLDWEQWFNRNYDPEQLLSDICISDPSLAEVGTPPRQREEERPEEDWDDARLALGHPQILDVLFEIASLTLRTHDTPMLMGPFDIQERKQAFKMRIVVVCAAREAATTQLAPDIIRLLGKTYVTEAAITKGIQIFCYVGASSRDEHLRANGDPGEYDNLLHTELRRILPLCRRPAILKSPPPPPQVDIESLVDQLNLMWQHDLQHDQSQVIENCYLIDSQLANRVAAVQQRPDEPDETVVATALALNMLITSNADVAVRQSQLLRSDLTNNYYEPGLFSTLGVASYSLDHPKLRRLVYNHVVGKFLMRIQPEVIGDDLQQTLRRNASKGSLLDEEVEAQIKQDTDRLCNDYKKRTDRKYIKNGLPRSPQYRRTINYRKAVRKLIHLRSSDVATVNTALEQILQELILDMEKGEIASTLLDRQREYESRLKNTFQELSASLPEHIQAPLTRIYRFSKGSYNILHEIARKVDAPATNVDLGNERRRFAEKEADRFDRKRSERAKAIRYEIDHRPKLMGLVSRSLLLAPLLVYTWYAFTTFLSGLFAQFLGFRGGFSVSSQVLSPSSSVPFWQVSAIAAGIAWIGLFLGYRWYYAFRLHKHVKELVRWHEEILKKADDEAWRLAVTAHLEERERQGEILNVLCKPRGMIASLRDALLKEQFVAQDRILERIFFDDQLQAKLRDISYRLAASNKLWLQRSELLKDMLDRTWQDRQQLDIWLRERTGEIHKEDAPLIVDLVEGFLKYQTAQRFEEIWHDLSNAAALFLRYSISVQKNPTTSIEMFGVNNLETLYELEDIMRRSGVEILNSSDRLRWIFMHVQNGLNLESIKFAAETQIP
jgi:hypothetical protein